MDITFEKRGCLKQKKHWKESYLKSEREILNIYGT